MKGLMYEVSNSWAVIDYNFASFMDTRPFYTFAFISFVLFSPFYYFVAVTSCGRLPAARQFFYRITLDTGRS